MRSRLKKSINDVRDNLMEPLYSSDSKYLGYFAPLAYLKTATQLGPFSIGVIVTVVRLFEGTLSSP